MKQIFCLLALLALVGCVPTTPVPNLDTSYTPTATVIPTQTPIPKTARVCLTVTATRSLYLRTGPGKSYAAEGWLPGGSHIQGLDQTNDWWQVQSNDTIGYVHSHYVEKCHVQTGYKNKRR